MDHLLEKNHQYLFGKKVFFSHKKLTRELVSALNEKKIAIVSGMRYSGKTKFLLDMIQKTGAQDDVFYFNCEVDTLGEILNTHDLDLLLNLYIRINGSPKIIILQNISKIQGIKEYIGQLYTEKKYKIIIVGNTIKIGGVTEIEISPLCIRKLGIEKTPSYIRYGGIEEVQLVRDLYFKDFILEPLTEHIISQDIVAAYDIKNKKMYTQVISFLAKIRDNISLRELQRELNSHGISIALMTLSDYVDASLKSKFLRKMSKYDVKAKKEIPTKLKYYFSDTGMRNMLLGNIQTPPLSLENSLFTELQKNGYTFYTGVNGRFEFTALANKDKKSLYIHLHNSQDKNELKKDARKLAKIPKNGKKFLLVADKSVYNLRKYILDDVQIVELGELVEYL